MNNGKIVEEISRHQHSCAAAALGKLRRSSFHGNEENFWERIFRTFSTLLLLMLLAGGARMLGARENFINYSFPSALIWFECETVEHFKATSILHFPATLLAMEMTLRNDMSPGEHFSHHEMCQKREQDVENFQLARSIGRWESFFLSRHCEHISHLQNFCQPKPHKGNSRSMNHFNINQTFKSLITIINGSAHGPSSSKWQNNLRPASAWACQNEPNLINVINLLTDRRFSPPSAHFPNWCKRPRSWDPTRRPSRNDGSPARSHLVRWTRIRDCSMRRQSPDAFRWLLSNRPTTDATTIYKILSESVVDGKSSNTCNVWEREGGSERERKREQLTEWLRQ